MMHGRFPIEGEVRVGGDEVVATWSTLRVGDRAEVNVYQTNVKYLDLAGNLHEADGNVTHRYRDGLPVLIMKVMAFAASQILLPEEDPATVTRL